MEIIGHAPPEGPEPSIRLIHGPSPASDDALVEIIAPGAPGGSAESFLRAGRRVALAGLVKLAGPWAKPAIEKALDVSSTGSGIRIRFVYPPVKTGLAIAAWIAEQVTTRVPTAPGADLLARHAAVRRAWTELAPLRAMARRLRVPFRASQAGDMLVAHLGAGRGYRRIVHTVSDGSSAAGAFASLHKDVAKALLREGGIPVPAGITARTCREAVAWAEKHGYPVVLKCPIGGNSDAMVLAIREARALRRAWQHVAATYGTLPLMVEAFIDGLSCRALAIDGRLIRVVAGRPSFVLADGTRTCEALLRKRLRATDFLDHPYERHRIRGVLLSQGLDFDRIPPRGARCAFTPATGNWRDITRHTRPATRALLEQAASGLGLALAGIDFVLPSAAADLSRGTGAVLEVNHSWGVPANGTAGEQRAWRRYYRRLVASPAALVALVGDSPSRRLGQETVRLLRRRFQHVRLAVAGQGSDPDANIMAAMTDRHADAIIVHYPAGRAPESGLYPDWFDVVICAGATSEAAAFFKSRLRAGGRAVSVAATRRPPRQPGGKRFDRDRIATLEAVFHRAFRPAP